MERDLESANIDVNANVNMQTPLLTESVERYERIESFSPMDVKTNRNTERNSYYPKFIILIGIFYILPSLQFVFFQSKEQNVFCYYNYKCYVSY